MKPLVEHFIPSKYSVKIMYHYDCQCCHNLNGGRTWTCRHVCTCVCVWIYVCTCAPLYVSVCVHVCISTFIGVHMHRWPHAHVCMNICPSMYTHVHVHFCAYVCTHSFTYTEGGQCCGHSYLMIHMTRSASLLSTWRLQETGQGSPAQ